MRKLGSSLLQWLLLLLSCLLLAVTKTTTAAFHQPQFPFKLYQNNRLVSRFRPSQFSPVHQRSLSSSSSSQLHVETSSSSSSTSTAAFDDETSSAVSRSSSNDDDDDDILKTIITPGLSQTTTLQRGEIATVSYSLYLVPSDTKTSSTTTTTALPLVLSRGKQQKVMVCDGTMIPGWDLALTSMRVGERSIIRIPSNLAYGTKGVPPLIPPHATLELDVTVHSVTAPAATIVGLDFDGLAYADNTPRTADQIAAAYEARQAQKALQPQKEGLEAWLDKARNFYFFGFFEGETGQRAPLLLRPSITFPIIFLLVGLAFYISFATGAISERGIPALDELDEIVLTTTTMTSFMMKQLVM